MDKEIKKTLEETRKELQKCKDELERSAHIMNNILKSNADPIIKGRAQNFLNRYNELNK